MVRTYKSSEIVWFDLLSPTELELRSLAEELNLPNQVTEELLLPTPKPRVDLYQECVFLIIHFPASRHSHRSRNQEIDFVIGKNFLITAHYEPVETLSAFGKSFEVESILKRNGNRGVGGLLFEMVLRLYRGISNELDSLESALKHMETQIFAGKEREMVRRLSEAGRDVLSFKQNISPHHFVWESFEAASEAFFGTEFDYYLTAIRSQCKKVYAYAENLMDTVAELRETNNALLSARQNEVTQELTVIASIFLPLALITQVFSINSEYIPIANEPDGFWVIIGMLLVVGVLTYAFFKYRRFL